MARLWRQRLTLLPALLLLVLAAAPAGAEAPRPGPGAVLLQQFSPSEQLGGELTALDLEAPLLSPLAMAEQGRVRNSRDPLEALPRPWRQPLRRLLPSQASLRWQRARVVHGSWPRLPRALVVPLVLHSDGSVDVFLDASGGAAVEQALNHLLQRLDLPPAGSIQPLLLELHPRSAASWPAAASTPSQ
jgi:hypothetical protein